MTPIALDLREWETIDCEDDPRLAGNQLGDSAARALAKRLDRSGAVTITELAHGLRVETGSFVGQVKVGPLDLRIRPKLDHVPWERLLCYGSRLRDLDAGPRRLMRASFQDLVLERLAAEVEDLRARGIRQDYRACSGDLTCPRGRIEFGELARRLPSGTSGLPCRYHQRSPDCLANCVLLAGLQAGAGRAMDRTLRRRLVRLAGYFQGQVTQVRLSAGLFCSLARARNRLWAAYEPALRLVHLLWMGAGLPGDAGELEDIPGFLIDMNRLFQAVISRFLQENLESGTVQDEHRLVGVFSWMPGGGERRRAPVPRPDFRVERQGRAPALLDAKYRDVALAGLPREMLYQLAIYALTASVSPRNATLLYPSETDNAPDEVVVVREPALGTERATVTLRRVSLERLARLLDVRSRDQRSRYAQYIAFGDRPFCA